MSNKLQLLFGGLAALSFAAHAAGVVEVKFVEPAKFTDAGSTPIEIERATDTLQSHLKYLAKALPDGQTLRIDVLDIDLAGTVKPTSRGDLRVVRGSADWPRIQLRYTLQSGGSTVKQGEDTVADLAYTGHLPGRYDEHNLAYEKRMLDKWFQQRFGASAVAVARP